MPDKKQGTSKRPSQPIREQSSTRKRQANTKIPTNKTQRTQDTVPTTKPKEKK